MSRLPALRPASVVRALERAGFVVRRVSGSHYQMAHPTDAARRATIPYHGKDLKRGTLRAIIKQSGLSVDEFLNLV